MHLALLIEKQSSATYGYRLFVDLILEHADVYFTRVLKPADSKLLLMAGFYNGGDKTSFCLHKAKVYETLMIFC